MDVMSNYLEKDFSYGSNLNRRSFIQYGSVIAGGLIISPLIGQAGIDAASPSDNSLFWYQKPLRIMHTVLRETDALHYNAEAVVDYLKKKWKQCTLCKCRRHSRFFSESFTRRQYQCFYGQPGYTERNYHCLQKSRDKNYCPH